MNHQPPMDQTIRHQALDCRQSFIIQAPAGSGKTELLTQRFLALLEKAEQPEEILAITFTRKAAGEMRERIINGLSLAQSTEIQPSAEPHRTTWRVARAALKRNAQRQWNLLENPQRLQVQTIDGFCANLTGRLPYLSRLGSEATTTERSAAQYTEAAKQTLALLNSNNKSWTQPLETLLLHLDGNQNQAERLLANMLAKRDQWLRHLAYEGDDLLAFRQQLESSLKTLIRDELLDKAEQLSVAEIEEIQMLSRYALENIRNADIKAPYFEDFDGELSSELNLETYPQWQAISRWLLTDASGLRKTMNKNRGFPAASSSEDKQQQAYFKSMKSRINLLLENLRDKESLFIELSQLPPTSYNHIQWQLLEALMRCLTLATGLLQVHFAQKGEMDFQEVSLRAIQALGSEDQPTNLTLALDYQLKHILIDEFQDTAHGQFTLLKKLLRGWQPDDGRTLFLVGDPMQSIYRFREADVGLFLQVRKRGIANIHPQPLQLTVNFRSTQNIVNWVNQHFVDILPQKEKISHGAVTYSKSIASDTSQAGGVEIIAHFDDDGISEALNLTEIVQQHTLENPDLSLAVLVKSRSQLALLIPAFQQAGLKFKATEIEQLGERPVITDLQMLTRALADPGDRVAWLALLRGPWCGLTLEDLLQISGSKDSSIMINCQTSQFLQQLSKDGAERLTHVMNKILPWITIHNRGSARQNVEGCWLSLDGPAYINGTVDIQASELYFDLLSAIEQGGCIKEPQELKQRLSELYAPVAVDANNNLQLMTIHKSKGLEFDTVILPCLNSGSRHDDATLLRWFELSLNNRSHLLMAPIHAHVKTPDKLYQYLSSIAKTQRHHESGRLLYVACTRAKRRLILSATLKTKPDPQACELSAKKGSQLHELWSAVESSFRLSVEKHINNHHHHQDIDTDEEAKDFRLSRTQEPLQCTSAHLFKDAIAVNIPASPSAEQPILYAASASKRHVGTVTHHWLEQIADNLEQWDIERINRQRPMLNNQLRQLGVSAAELNKSVDLVTHNLQQTLSDEQGRYLLSKHQQAASEIAFERYQENEVKSYVIDRSFIDEQGIRWIIDYKTSSHQGAGHESFIEQQKQHYRDQLNNYAAIFAAIDPRPIKLVLYFTCYQLLISWDWEGNSD